MKNLDISCIRLAVIFMLAIAADGGKVDTLRYSRILPSNYRGPSSSGGNHRRYYSAVQQRGFIIHRRPGVKLHVSSGQKLPQSTSFLGTGVARGSPVRAQPQYVPVVRPSPHPAKVKSTNRYGTRSLKSSLMSALRR